MATFTADALISPRFSADAVITATRTSPFTTYSVNDDFTRTTTPPGGGIGSGYRWTNYDSYWATAGESESYVDGSALRVPVDRYDSYAIGAAPFDPPEQGTLEFDFRVPTDSGDNFWYVEVVLDRVPGGTIYLGIEGRDASNIGVYSWWDSTQMAADRGAMYRVRLTWDLTHEYVYAWKVGDPEPGSPLHSGTRSPYENDFGTGDNVIDIGLAPTTEAATFDNLRIYSTIPLTGNAIVGQELVRDTFSRTTSPGDPFGTDDLGNTWVRTPANNGWSGSSGGEYLDGSQVVLPGGGTGEFMAGIGSRFSTGFVSVDFEITSTCDGSVDIRGGGAEYGVGGYVSWDSYTGGVIGLNLYGETFPSEVTVTPGWHRLEVAVRSDTTREIRVRRVDTGALVVKARAHRFDYDSNNTTGVSRRHGILLYAASYHFTETLRLDNLVAYREALPDTFAGSFTAAAIIRKTQTGKAAPEAPTSHLFTNTNSDTNIALTLTAGAVQQGDLLTAVVIRRMAASNSFTGVFSASGWQLVSSIDLPDPSSPFSRVAVGVWMKTVTADAGASSYQFTVSNSGNSVIGTARGWIMGHRGPSGGPWRIRNGPVTNAVVNTSGSSITAPSLEIDGATLVLLAAGSDITNSATTLPGTFTSVAQSSAGVPGSGAVGWYYNTSPDTIAPTASWGASLLARSISLLTITGTGPGFTADAVLEPIAGGVGSFTASAFFDVPTLEGSFTASALRLRTQTGSVAGRADILRGLRLYASLSVDAVVRSNLSSFQQHSRGDAFHAGTTPSDMVLTTATVGPWPPGSVLHDVLAWLWGQYSADTSVNHRWSGFAAAAVRLRTQAQALAAAAWFTEVGSSLISSNAVLLRAQAGSLTGDAWFFAPGVTTVESAFSAEAELEAQPLFTADAVTRRSSTTTVTADAVVA